MEANYRKLEKELDDSRQSIQNLLIKVKELEENKDEMAAQLNDYDYEFELLEEKMAAMKLSHDDISSGFLLPLIIIIASYLLFEGLLLGSNSSHSTIDKGKNEKSIEQQETASASALTKLPRIISKKRKGKKLRIKKVGADESKLSSHIHKANPNISEMCVLKSISLYQLLVDCVLVCSQDRIKRKSQSATNALLV